MPFNVFMSEKPFLIAISCSLLIQLLKGFAAFARHGKLDFRRFVRTGGMPSSHAASVSSLSMAVGLKEGFSSALFGVTLFFSLIIMYDAAGLRRAAGRQAEVLNRILDDHYSKHKVGEERLLELLGHTPFEVLVGAVTGVLFAFIWY
ncbi:MAG: divergent PAP2 family protein [Candidatus Eisenbacteria bacterium]|nr:divergent PAP2 family protein [Candidatus Eisenbacteria bacterium]